MTARHFIAAFLVTLALYVVAFNWIEFRRSRNGPWQVTFTTVAGSPALVINQPKLRILNLKIIFPNAPAASARETLRFDHARPVPFTVPFGQCVFLDTISLPGTVAFQMFGHEIQLMPRVLTIDGREQPWSSNATLKLE